MKLIANVRLALSNNEFVEAGQEFEIEDKRGQMVLADKRDLVKKAKESAKKDGDKKSSKK